MGLYGDGYQSPAVLNLLADPHNESGQAPVYGLAEALAGLPRDSLPTRALRSGADGLRWLAKGPEDVPTNGKLMPFLLRAGAEGANTAANWLDRRPMVGPDTLAPLGGAGVGAAAVHAAKAPLSPLTESVANKLGRWAEATVDHQRMETKRGNPYGFYEGLGALGLSTAAMLSGDHLLSTLGGTGAILTRPGSVLMKPHFDNIKNIAGYYRAMELREAAKRPLPDNSGTTLYANSSHAALPGTIVDGSPPPQGNDLAALLARHGH